MLDVSAKQGALKRIRLVIVDQQPIVLQGLKSVLGTQQDFDLVASFSDGTSCLEAIRNLRPDVALIADTLPDLTTSEILAIVKAEKLSTRLAFFTGSDIDHDLTAAIAAGGCSAISKYVSPATMLRSLRLITASGVSLQQSDLSPIGKEGEGDKIEKMLELLTHRERQIVRLVSEGMSNKEIARQLNLSPGTVKVHLYHIFQKLEITNRTVLATLALLQRPSGFGTLALAFLAIAIADELKASEANDMLPDDNSIGHAREHAEYEPWKKAILRHLIVWDSAETPPLTQRDHFAKLSQVTNQVTNPAAAMETLREAEQSVGSKPGKGDSSVGSSTPNLATLLLRGMNDTQIGGDPTPDHQVPRLTSNPMSLHGGYGTFATLAGALIYALHDPHLAVQSHDPGQASIDSFLASIGDNATTKVAAIPHVDANHADNSAPDFLSRDFQPPSAVATTANDNVAPEGVRGQTGPDAAGDNLQKSVGVLDFGHDSGMGGYSRDQLMGGNVENVVYRSPTDSKSTSSDSVLDFASGPSRINLAAFGALAWLHMTAASKSIPPHTLAWIYNSASNETIVYVNPTDRTLDVGDRGLLEIHLQGIVSIAESDFGHQSEGAAVAATLEQLEQALIPATASDETVPGTDSIHASESELGTAGVWGALVDDGLSFRFAQSRTGLGTSTKFKTFTSASADTTEESAGASGVPAYESSIAPGHNAAAPAVETLTSKSEPTDADTGILSIKQNEIVQSGLATADGMGRGNSEHASEPGSAKAATETAEAESKPGNGFGNDNEHHSQAAEGSPGAAKTAEPGGVERSNSGHSASAKGPEAAEGAQPSVATADTDGRGNSQHAAEPESAKVVAMGMPEAKSKPGNGIGNDNEHHSQAPDGSPEAAKTGEPGGVEHSSRGHSASAKAADAGESVATSGETDHGNSQHPAELGSAKVVATEMPEAKSKPGNGIGNDNEHQSQASDAADAQAALKTAEPAAVEHGKSGHDLPSTSTNAVPGLVDPSVAGGDYTAGGNPQQPARFASIASEAQPAKAASEISGTDQEAAFRFDSGPAPSTLVSVVEHKEVHDPHVALGREDDLKTIVETVPHAMDEHAAHQGNNGPHQGIGPAPHDWLI